MLLKRLAAIALIVGLAGCAEDAVAPTPIPNITVNVNQIVYAPTPTTPGSGPGQSGRVTAVSIGKYGEEGCANPTNDPGTVRVGCTALLTCTPKCGTRDCTPDEHGSSPSFFGTTENAGRVQVFDDDTGNQFNLDAKGVSAGTAKLRCDVLGVSSRDRDLVVVQ